MAEKERKVEASDAGKEVKQPKSEAKSNTPIQDMKKATASAARERRKKRSAHIEEDGYIISADGIGDLDTPSRLREKRLNEYQISKSSERFMTGVISGAREVSFKKGAKLRCAVIRDDAGFQVLIPAPFLTPSIGTFSASDDNYDRNVSTLVNSYIGAKVDYMVQSIDAENSLVIGNRLEAMEILEDRFYLAPNRNTKQPTVRPGVVVKGRIVNSKRHGVIIEAVGVEFFVPNHELSYTWVSDAAALYPVGTEVAVKILEVEYTSEGEDRTVHKVEGSVKEAFDDPRIRMFESFALQDKTFGIVTGITDRGIFVNLGNIDCLCLFPKFGEIPEIGDKVNITITRKLEDKLFLNGIITYIAAQ